MLRITLPLLLCASGVLRTTTLAQDQPTDANLHQALIAQHTAEAVAKKAAEDVTLHAVEVERQLATAMLQVLLAERDLRRYQEGDAVGTRVALSDTITLATERHEQSTTRLHWSERLADQGLISQASLELDQAAAERTQSELKIAREQLRVFDETKHQLRLVELKAAVEAARSQLASVTSAGKTKSAELQSLVDAATRRRNLAREQVAVIRDVLGVTQPRFVADSAIDLKQHQVDSQQALARLRQAQSKAADDAKRAESEEQTVARAAAAAQLELEEFRQGEAKQRRHDQRNVIRGISEKLDAAQQQLAWSKRVIRKGYITPSELAADRLTVVEAEIALKAAKHELKMLESHTLPRTEAELESNVKQARDEAARAATVTGAISAKAKADVEARRKIYELHVQYLAGQTPSSGTQRAAAGGG